MESFLVAHPSFTSKFIIWSLLDWWWRLPHPVLTLLLPHYQFSKVGSGLRFPYCYALYHQRVLHAGVY